MRWVQEQMISLLFLVCKSNTGNVPFCMTKELNWPKRDQTNEINIVIQGIEIPKIGKSGKYQYLGLDFSLDGKSNNTQVNKVGILD